MRASVCAAVRVIGYGADFCVDSVFFIFPLVVCTVGVFAGDEGFY